VGLDNVVQVITNYVYNCKAMDDLLIRDYPLIVWSPCIAHCLDLLIEDIIRLPWVKNIITKVKQIVNFVTKKPKVLAIYRTFKDLNF
jgi:hypothetical protein